jgi:hypothetical protein
MVEITEQASAVLIGSLTESDVESGRAFRFSDDGDGQIRVEKNEKQDHDIELEREGTPVLFVPGDLVEKFGDVTVDVAPSSDNQGLRLVLRQSEPGT